jgi:hypothetical protein
MAPTYSACAFCALCRPYLLGAVMMAVLLVHGALADQDCSQFLQYSSDHTTARYVSAASSQRGLPSVLFSLESRFPSQSFCHYLYFYILPIPRSISLILAVGHVT